MFLRPPVGVFYKYEIFDDVQGYILLKRLCKISTNWLMEVKQARFFQSYDTLTRELPLKPRPRRHGINYSGPLAEHLIDRSHTV